MNRVTVFNDNTYPLKQMFKGDTVEIGAKDYWRDANGKPRVMDVYEAAEFKGAYLPTPLDTNGRLADDPRYYKILKLEPAGEGARGPSREFVCMAQGCKEAFEKESQLAAHTRADHAHLSTLEMPDQDREIETKKGKR